MTAQAHDQVLLEGVEFSLVGVSGGPLFEPTEHGIQPDAGACSACWRGFVCHYAVAEARFILDGLTLWVGMCDGPFPRKPQVPPPLAGRLPKATDYTGRHLIYDGLGMPIPFSGGLLLGEGFVQRLYVHMGFHPAWKFTKVCEIIVKEGVVTGTVDRSQQMAELRRRIKKESRTASKQLGNAVQPTYAERLGR